MKTTFFGFGEQRAGHDEPVLNERAVRGAAGILFAMALIGFMRALLLGDFAFVRWFAVLFLLDFVLRLFVTPKAAPSLIVAQWLVRHQQPEWVSAAPKRFAWILGLLLATSTVYLFVFKGLMGPWLMLSCMVCLVLMFFESALGICIGCWLYGRIFKKPPNMVCAGDVCSYTPEPKAGGKWWQGAVLLGFAVLMGGIATQLPTHHAYPPQGAFPAGQDPLFDAPMPTAPIVPSAEQERCKVPEFAKAIGHEKQWKLHNNCQ
jgi:Domain of unknown function (DUF4395)